jgi:hypothetical protein
MQRELRLPQTCIAAELGRRASGQEKAMSMQRAVLAAGFVGLLLGVAAPAHPASEIHGYVFLEGQTQHAGSSVEVGSEPAELSQQSGALLAVALAAGALLARRRRAAVAALALGLATLATAALQVVSDASGAYQLSPPGGGTFAAGQYRIRFEHEGYQPAQVWVQVQSGAGVAEAEPVTLRPLAAACTVFPADNPWNTDVSGFPLHPDSDRYVDFIGRSTRLHPDFGTFWQGAPIGIPYVEVPASQPKLPVDFLYASESDPGPYPIPPDPPIEGGADSTGDRHILMVDREACLLYELYWAWPPGVSPNTSPDRWYAGSGAIFDLRSNALRPDGWTSADAAGLPIFPALPRYEEVVEQGVVTHALRFTVRRTSRGYIHPATHFAPTSNDPDAPPMGLRFRMKAGYDCSGHSSEVQVLCAALKKYGMLLADNGSNWYVSGAHDPRWSDSRLGDLKRVTGDAFEVVYTGPILGR